MTNRFRPSFPLNWTIRTARNIRFARDDLAGLGVGVAVLLIEGDRPVSGVGERGLGRLLTVCGAQMVVRDARRVAPHRAVLDHLVAALGVLLDGGVIGASAFAGVAQLLNAMLETACACYLDQGACCLMSRCARSLSR